MSKEHTSNTVISPAPKHEGDGDGGGWAGHTDGREAMGTTEDTYVKRNERDIMLSVARIIKDYCASQNGCRGCAFDDSARMECGLVRPFMPAVWVLPESWDNED